MKKIKIISGCLLGLSLLFGAANFACQKGNLAKTEETHADVSLLFIGTHDLKSNPTCQGSPYTGKATLETKTDEYVITLDGFNNNNTVKDTSGVLTTGLIVYNSTYKVTIKVKGTCTISNNNTSVSTAYGAYITANSNPVTIIGEGTNPTLNFVSPQITANGGDSTACGVSCSNLTIQNCNVNFTAGKSYSATGLSVSGSLTVNSGAKINATANGTSSGAGSNKSIAIQSKDYNQNAGEVTATSKDATGTSYSFGLYVSSGNALVRGGKLTATSGKSGGRSSSGIRVGNGKLTLQGGEISAKASETTYVEGADCTSMGIYLGNPSDTNFVDIKSGLQSLYAHGKDRGINCQVISKYLGYTSDAEDIYSQTTFGEFKANEKAYVLYKTVLFRKMTFVVVTTGEVNYDGSDYNALDIEVSVPASGYTIEYSTDGGETWSTTNPVFSAASDDPYVINYKITSKLYAPIFASVELTIHKVASLVNEAPTLVSGELTYNGSAQSLVSGGSATGGTLVYSLNGGEYSENASVTNAGTYSVSYKVAGDENHFDTDPVNLGSITIGKAANSIIKKPSLVSGLSANGKEQKIVVPGKATYGTILYSVNGGEFSEKVPSVKEAGTYSVSFKVEENDNYYGVEVEFLGSVVVAKGSINPNPSGKGIGAGAVVGIILGSLVFVVGAAYLVLFFLLNKWIKVGDKAVRVMRFALGSKDGKERYLSFKCKFEYRDKNEVFNSKEEALK